VAQKVPPRLIPSLAVDSGRFSGLHAHSTYQVEITLLHDPISIGFRAYLRLAPAGHGRMPDITYILASAACNTDQSLFHERDVQRKIPQSLCMVRGTSLLVDTMQHTDEQYSLPHVESRDPTHCIQAMRLASFPSERRIT
jgi:hypothetical protein